MTDWTEAKSILQRVLDNEIDEHDTRYLVDAVKTSIKALNIAERVEKHWNEIKDDSYHIGTENCYLCETYEEGFRDAIEYAVRGDIDE